MKTVEEAQEQHLSDMDGTHSARLALALGMVLLPWEVEALHARREVEDDGYHDHIERDQRCGI